MMNCTSFDGASCWGAAEWRSQLVPRYQRRSERVDEAILGVYLSGTNTRRIKGALAPLLHGGPLSKDAVSRLVGCWRSRGNAEIWTELGAGHGGRPGLYGGDRRDLWVISASRRR